MLREKESSASTRNFCKTSNFSLREALRNRIDRLTYDLFRYLSLCSKPAGGRLSSHESSTQLGYNNRENQNSLSILTKIIFIVAFIQWKVVAVSQIMNYLLRWARPRRLLMCFSGF